jgi:WD40 repeat protein
MIALAALLLGALLAQESSERVDLQNDPLPHGAVARLGSTRLRHGDSVHWLSFSPDGRFLISGSSGGGGGGDASVRVWEVWTGTPVRQITIGEVSRLKYAHLAISPKADVVAVGWADGVIHLWDLTSGSKLRELTGHTTQVAWMAFSPDGSRLASASYEGTLRIWDPATGNQVALFDARKKPDEPWWPSSGAISPEGGVVYSLMISGELRSWQLPDLSERPLTHAHSRMSSALAFSPDGTLGATGGEGLRFFNPKTGKSLDPSPQQDLRREEPSITGLAFSADGKTLAAARMDKKIVLLDLPERKERKSLELSGPSVYTLTFSPDSRILAAGGNDGAIRLWDVKTGLRLPLACGSEDTIWWLAVSPDGRMASTGTYHGLLRRWELPTGKPLPPVEDDRGASGLAFSPDGKTLATATHDRLRLLDAASGKTRTEVSTDISSIISMAFSPDGKRLAARDQAGPIRVWEVATAGEVLKIDVLRAVDYNWTTITYAPDGKCFVAGTAVRPATLWDATTGELVRAMSTAPGTITGLSYSPDGKVLAAGSTNGTILLYDPSTGTELRVLKGHQGEVCKVAFSPDGKILASVGSDRLVHLWDPVAGKELAARAGHLGILTGVAFSGDGKLLVTGGYDGTGLVWDVGTALTEPRPKREEPMSMQQAWDALASTRAELALRAAQTLAAAPVNALAFLNQRLLAREYSEQVTRLISTLSDDEVAARRKASLDLMAFGDEAETELQAALAGAEGELRILVSEVLEKAHGPVPASSAVVRRLRAIRLLEEIGTPEALQYLQSIQPNLASERERKEAKAALARLSARRK